MQKQNKEKTKVIVRRLPPALSEESFKTILDKYAEGKYDWVSYYPGKVSIRKVVFSRAYVNFILPEHVYEFKAKFDGHVFVSNKGNQYKCTVEYAPFQKVPKPQTKKDTRDGTIDKDPDYQEFVRLLEEGPVLLPSAVHQLEKREAEEKAAGDTSKGPNSIVTPLMEFLRQKYVNGLKRSYKGKGRESARIELEKASKKQLELRNEAVAASTESKGRKKEGRGRGKDSKGREEPVAIVHAEKPAAKPTEVSRREGSAKGPQSAQGNKREQAAEPSKKGVPASKIVLVHKAELAVTAALTRSAPAVADAESAQTTPEAAAAAAATSAVAAAVNAAVKPLANRKVRAGYQTWVPSVMKTGHSALDPDSSKPSLEATTDRPVRSAGGADPAAESHEREKPAKLGALPHDPPGRPASGKTHRTAAPSEASNQSAGSTKARDEVQNAKSKPSKKPSSQQQQEWVPKKPG